MSPLPSKNFPTGSLKVMDPFGSVHPLHFADDCQRPNLAYHPVEVIEIPNFNPKDHLGQTRIRLRKQDVGNV